VQEICMRRAMWRRLETGAWDGLRHRQKAKAAGNSYSPPLRLPRQSSTLPRYLTRPYPQIFHTLFSLV
jgi:hypothetical protein